jgi:hypothetical protein
MSLELPRIWWRPEHAEFGRTWTGPTLNELGPGIHLSGELTKVGDVSRALDTALGLDLEDDDAILAFVHQYGPMRARKHELATGIVYVALDEVVTDEGLIGSREPDGSYFSIGWIEGMGDALLDFRGAAGALRALAALRTHLEDWVSIQALRVDWPEYSPWEPPARKSDAADNYEWAINEALKYLTLEVHPVWPAGLVEGAARLRWCLYARCVLELLSASHAPRRCARDDCGQWFTEQRDRRTKTAKRRSDAIYCSVRCGQIVAARTWRRRNRKPKGGS